MPELHEVNANKGRTSGTGGSNPADIGGHNPGNDPDASVEFAAVGNDGAGAPLGAASGVETGGTANMPAPVTEMDWGPAGTGMGVSGTGGAHDLGSGTDHPLPRSQGGLTHGAGYDTTRTTGGLVQHPSPANMVRGNTTGGTGAPQGNAQGLENPGAGASEGMVGSGQGNAMMGGGQDQSPLVDPSSGDESREQSNFSAT
jgi:hypothetical protein